MDTFGTVLVGVALVAIVVSCLSYLRSGAIYRGLGRSGLSFHEPDEHPGAPAGSAAGIAEAEEEIRQLLEAKSARRVARGEPPLDVEAEVERHLRQFGA